MGMLEESRAYKPFIYPWAHEAWDTQHKIHWLPEEIPLNSDVVDWKSKMTAEEKELAVSILTFFTQADIDVENAYVKHYLPRIKNLEIQRMLLSFADMETIHVNGYAHLLNTLGFPEETYSQFLEYEAMLNKHKFTESFKSESKTDLAITMASIGGFIEGLQLFASFCVLLNFQRMGKLRGCGQIVAWSVRDETLHCQSTIRMFKTFMQEYGAEIDHDRVESSIIDTCMHAVLCEDAFLDLAFTGGRVKGLCKEEVKKFIRHIADLRMEQLGYKPMFNQPEDPLPWFNEIIGGVEHTSFFENRPTAYSKSGTTGTWDNIF